LKRTIEKPFTQVQWLVNGTPYSVTENTNTSNTVTIPASVLSTCGSHTISMSVRYSGATADSLYTGTVWLNIPPVVSVIASSSAVCSNTPVTFTATVSGGSTSPMTYSWNIGGVAATTTSNTYVTTLTTTSTYSVSITNSDGCTSGFTAPQTITVIAEGVTPTITISASDNNICAGTSVIYTSNISNGGSSPGYQWLINEVAPVTGSTGSSYTYTPGNGDEITCVLTSSDPSACSGSVTSNKITMTVTPTANPSVTIHAMPD
ncbi:MAG: PKD domain-containing protein, partial [Prevotellaceae bacterium]|nr:PKD domain-containing protein [Prevotellaceae bacterium]